MPGAHSEGHNPNKPMSKKKIARKGKLIKDLNAFLDWRGCGDDPGQWARAYYKYTACGPWVNFVIKDKPESIESYTFYVRRNAKGKLHCITDQPTPSELLRPFGFDADGVPKRGYADCFQSLKSYSAAVRKYQERFDKLDDTKITLIAEGPTNPKPGEHRWVMVRFTHHTPASTRDVYYEDLRRGTSPPVTNDTCFGIEFGSIVEGSDANSGPFRHMFPFRTSEWERDEEFMEKETSFFWTRDNASWYTVRTAVEEWTVANVWGDIEWEGDPPPDDIKALAEKAIKEDWQDDPEHSGCIVQTIPKMPGMWKDPQPDWKAMPLGDTEAEIFTFENDTTFD